MTMKIDRSRFDKYKVPNAFNNNPKITGYRIATHSPDWYAFRATGFGASEIGLVCGKANYGKILPKLLEEKAGISKDETKLNEHMLSGILAEPIIAERWRYYDGTQYGYIDNYTQKRVVRECGEVEMYLVHEDYPWLFVSLDRRILANQDSLSAEVGRLKQDHPLELKQISYFASQKWEYGVPPTYIYQLHQQMIVCEVEYGELAALKDGHKFDVYPFVLDMQIADEIVTESYHQWQIVENMKKMHAEAEYYKSVGRWEKAAEYEAKLQSLMPLPDSNEGWKDFLSERYIKEKEEVEGRTEIWRYVRWIQRLDAAGKLIGEMRQMFENRIRAAFVSANAEYMTFGMSGRIRHYKQKGDKNYRLDLRGIKDKTRPESVKEDLEGVFAGMK